MSELNFESRLAVCPELVYEWHTKGAALERLIPPWEAVRLLEGGGEIAEGSRVTIEVRRGWMRHRWVAEHFDLEEGHAFSDRQVLGPFKAWTHRHEFGEEGAGITRLKDRLRFEIPGGMLGEFLLGKSIKKSITRAFKFRHERTQMDLERLFNDSRFRRGIVLISGQRGLVGRELSALLRTLGYRVRGLTRRPKGTDEFGWDPMAGVIDENAFKGVCAVVHLAGENVAGGRWTAGRRAAILESRRRGTRMIAEVMARICPKKTVLVLASGVNIYPADGEGYDETGPSGEGFLNEVCREWEKAADPAIEAGMRVVTLRIGAVLTPGGGALGKMLMPFSWGLGGRLGTGNQRFSWIVMDDLTEIIVRAIEEETMTGAYNATAPGGVSQQDFARTLAKVLRRPALVALPRWLLGMIFGREFVDETILANLEVIPGRLKAEGYRWRFPELESGLRFILGRKG